MWLSALRVVAYAPDELRAIIGAMLARAGGPDRMTLTERQPRGRHRACVGQVPWGGGSSARSLKLAVRCPKQRINNEAVRH
jgi:hypothetical protein